METKQQERNAWRDRYLEFLAEPISYNGGKTTQSRVGYPGKWRAIPPYSQVKDISNSQVWVWSDLHFNHNNIINFSDRPYPDISTMNTHLVENYNDYVQENDVGIWVGDVAFASDKIANEILAKCRGYKILVIGNHDFDGKKLKKLNFDEVHLVYTHYHENTKLVFTHYPMDFEDKSWINCHGHEHIGTALNSKYGRSLNHINVNCELHDYKPIDFNLLLTWAKLRYNSMETKSDLNL